MNAPQSISKPAPAPVERFGDAHLVSVVRNAQSARVILRTVLLALHAQDNGSIADRDTVGASRWSFAVGAALARLDAVRDVLISTSDAAPIDWPTPHTLTAALDSALWDGYCTSAPVLSSEETSMAVQVVIDAMDDLLQECAMVAKAAPVMKEALSALSQRSQ